MGKGGPLRLGDYFHGLTGPAEALVATGITADSRNVGPGLIFAALAGNATDGRKFISDALANGAMAILTDERPLSADIPIVHSADPRRDLARLAARFAGPPPEVIVGVTGTAGKTSVAEFTRQIFSAAGHSAVSIGTLGIEGAVHRPGGLTTPDPVVLHKNLADLAAAGVTHCAMEASSHGIDQRRLDGVSFAAAAFTNLGRDHLDYHPTVEDYFAAKRRLFDRLLPADHPAVVDPDAPFGDQILVCRPDALTVGWRGDFLRIVSREPLPVGAQLSITGQSGRYDITLPLVGIFQTDNALISATLAIAAGVPEATAVNALASLKGAPGRLERVGDARGAPVFVDYAHKPDAVSAALGAVRPAAKGRLIVVIGAGGDRDPGKRPLMGKAAAAIADLVIITDDNPRSEDPATIRAAIMAATPGAVEIGDRAEAIEYAISELRDGDALVIAGKGHEEGQTVAGVTHPFSDKAVAQAAIAAL
ncbi:MAG: UDP-N-acetylmuramoyl-L-alanyl-D-glutamate--2,6-diaminopimelate ligase [Pseudomonadota bacterium]